jgi:hypothetical protein
MAMNAIPRKIRPIRPRSDTNVTIPIDIAAEIERYKWTPPIPM